MKRTCILAACVALAAISAFADTTTLSNKKFSVIVDKTAGGVTSLKLPGDAYDTNYIAQDRCWGDVLLRWRNGTGQWIEASASTSSDVRLVTARATSTATVDYARESAEQGGLRGVRVSETFDLQPDALIWTITLRNGTSDAVEVGDVGLPLPFNTSYGGADPVTIFTKRLIKHAFVSGDGSFIFWERANGVGPYLVMTPGSGTHLEYYTQKRRAGYVVFIHAKAQGVDIDSTGTWRQPLTSLTLQPSGAKGDTATFSFKFQWTKDYAGVRDVLVREGLVDVRAVPGMVVPQDMPAKFSLRTKQKITRIVPEFPESTKVTFERKASRDTAVYNLSLSKIGENRLTVEYGDGRKMYLEYFCTQPAETVIKKRASFIVRKQQWRDPSKWYNGLYSIWDMEEKVLRSPDDTDGLRAYMVGGSDDPTNCKAPYVAAKNLSFPVQSEIDSVEYYIKNFLWGGMQRKDTETPYPYGIYGIDNWYQNRNSTDGFGTGRGQEHLWRSFDYPAIIYLYHTMYKLAKCYPDKVHYLDYKGYLDRACNTAKAYYEVPYGIRGYWGDYTDWSYKVGIYNELCIPDLIDDLRAEGRAADADFLKNEWEKKVKYYTFDASYPFGSEYAFDSTAYESTHAAAKYGVDHVLQPDDKLWFDKNDNKWYSHPKVAKSDFQRFMEKETDANIADRAWLEPAYYLMGSDVRAGGTAGYLLSYMAQMGGWAVLDYGLYYSRQPEEHVGLGYASYLSSWALVNTGDAKSNYGYWFPGPENDGAAGWGFEPQKIATPWYGLPQGRGVWVYDGEIDHGFMGGLRSAATVVVDDPVFGLFAYGGEISRSGDTITVHPKDGLRQRFHMMNVSPRLHTELERDGLLSVTAVANPDKTLRSLSFVLENRSGDPHNTGLRVVGLPAGRWTADVDGHNISFAAASTAIQLPVPKGLSCTVTLSRLP